MNSLEDIRESVLRFKPGCVQEEKDKEMVLKYIKDFPNILSRDNEYAHFTSSSLIFNKDRTKTLFVYHNIYNSWTWRGHCDGNPDLLKVALTEAKEETGVDCKPISNDIITIEILPVWGHMKRGKFVSSHQHINQKKKS